MRERAYLGAVEALYGKGELKERRRAYEAAMARIQEDYPTDLEGASLHALALLSCARVESRICVPSVQAAAIVEDVLRRNPTHPGATHYLIHAYDDPLLAPLGLPVARRYARIAPKAEHALHMPSHIFVHLGLWDDVVSSNEAAWTASKAWVKRKGRPNEDLDLHAAAWLHYGYLQQGRYARAKALSDSLGALFLETDQPGPVRHYLTMVSCQNVVETRRPDSTPGVVPRPWEQVLQAASGAMPRGDSASVAAAVAGFRLRADTIASHHGQMPPESGPSSASSPRWTRGSAGGTKKRWPRSPKPPRWRKSDHRWDRRSIRPPVSFWRICSWRWAGSRWPRRHMTPRCSAPRSAPPCCSAEPERRRSPGTRKAPRTGTVCWRETGKPPTPTSRSSPKSGPERRAPRPHADARLPRGRSSASSRHPRARASWPR